MTNMLMKKNDQKGVVSLLVCMIMIVVISLIAVGFTELSDNEQKSALGSQLSETAYYAADSGINYATSVIQKDINTGQPITSQTACNPNNMPNGSSPYISPAPNASNNLSATYNVSYPCVIVNPSPSSLPYDIAAGEARPIPINIATAGSSLTFTWSNQTPGNLTYSGCPQYGAAQYTLPKSQPTNCDASILKIDIATSNNLLAASQVIYLYPACVGAGASCSNPTPSQDRGTLPAATTPPGIFGVACGSGSPCTFTLN
jgi:Tfp pilus assembly protein PilX